MRECVRKNVSASLRSSTDDVLMRWGIVDHLCGMVECHISTTAAGQTAVPTVFIELNRATVPASLAHGVKLKF